MRGTAFPAIRAAKAGHDNSGIMVLQYHPNQPALIRCVAFPPGLSPGNVSTGRQVVYMPMLLFNWFQMPENSGTNRPPVLSRVNIPTRRQPVLPQFSDCYLDWLKDLKKKEVTTAAVSG
ncbi:MAG: hypothetical protein Kow0037_14230 [Calditrichia bacterium]